jgi:hypothetical protein
MDLFAWQELGPNRDSASFLPADLGGLVRVAKPHLHEYGFATKEYFIFIY